MFKRFIACLSLLLLPTLAHAQFTGGAFGSSGGGGGGGGGGTLITSGAGDFGAGTSQTGGVLTGVITTNPSFTVNALPTIVSTNACTLVGSGTTMTCPPPASIVNGNLLIARIFSQSSPNTVTIPGFTQIAAATNVAGSKVTIVTLCKVAASESGNYTVTYGSSTTPLGGGAIEQIAGGPATCAFDGTATTANANSTSLTIAGISNTTNTNDLLYVAANQAANPASLVVTSTGLATIGTGSSGGNSFLWTLPNVSGTPASIVIKSTASDAIAGVMIAIPPGLTASQASVTQFGQAVLGSLHLTGGAQFDSLVQGTVGFIAPNTGSSSGVSGFFTYTTTGLKESLLQMNVSNNLAIDVTKHASLLAFGDSVGNGEMDTVMSPGTVVGYGFWTPDSGTEDVPGMMFDTGGNLRFGCWTGGASGSICSDANSQYKDMYFGVKTGQGFHIAVNAVDVATMSATQFRTIAGAVSGVAPQTLATFPACAAGTEGAYAVQIDSAVACVAGITAAAGGGTHCAIYCNGANWVRTGF